MKSLEVTDAQSAAVQKTPNRVTLESMLKKIRSEQYIHPDCLPSMTICVMQMENGFVVIGQAAPADPENFNKALGQQYAYEDCIRKLWEFEGYALRELLAAGRSL